MVSIKKGLKKITDRLHDENDKITSKLYDDIQQDSNRKEIDNDDEVDSWDKFKEEIEAKIVDTVEKTDNQPPINEKTQKIPQYMSKEEEQKMVDFVKSHTTTGLKDVQSTNSEKNFAGKSLRSASEENVPSSFTNYKKQTQTQNSNLDAIYNDAAKIKSQDDDRFKITTSNVEESIGTIKINSELAKLKSQKDSILGELKQILQQKEIGQHEYEKLLADEAVLNKEFDIIKKELSVITSERDSVIGELKHLKPELIQSNNELEKLNHEKDSIITELNNLKPEITSTQNKYNELKTEKDQIEQNVNQLKQKLDEFNLEFTTNKKENQRITHENETLNKEIKSINSQITSFEQELNDVEPIIEKTRKINEKLQNEKSVFEKELASLKSERDHIKGELHLLKPELKEVSEENKKFTEQNKIIKNENEKIKSDKIYIEYELNQIKEEITAVRAENKRLTSENESLSFSVTNKFKEIAKLENYDNLSKEELEKLYHALSLEFEKSPGDLLVKEMNSVHQALERFLKKSIK